MIGSRSTRSGRRRRRRIMRPRRQPSDLPGTALVLALCDRCDDGGNKPEVLYFDAAGQQLGDA